MPVEPPEIGIDVDISNINTFIAKLGDFGGPGTFHRFFAMVVPPAAGGLQANMEDLTWLCEVAEFPGKQLLTSEAHEYGPKYHVPFMMEFDTIDLTFLCRDHMTERLFFDEWMDNISPVNNWDFDYPDDYEGSVHIYHVSHTNTSYYKYIMRRAYPVAIAKQPLLWAEEQIQRLTVTFAYTDWVREGIDV